MGAGQLVSTAAALVRTLARRVPSAQRWNAPFVTTALLASIFTVAIAPAVSNQLVQQPRPIAMAGYWAQTADWLRAHSGGGRALVVPGAGRPEMVWGSTVDEPLQAEAESPWAIRETVPLAQAGYVRLLDEIEALLATGVPQPALAPLLVRSGIGHLVLRADLQPTADATDLGLVMSTVLNSPGLEVVTSFGPLVRDTVAANRLFNLGIANDVPAIQILRVEGGAAKLSLMDAEHPVLANGSAEQLPYLIQAGLAPRTPVLFGADAEAVTAAGPVPVLTDGLRKREVQFGHPGPVAATMSADQPYQATRVAHDYLPDNAGPLSTFGYSQITDVRASSAGSDSAALLNRGPEHAPWYALDADPATAWLSGSADGAVGQWLEVRLAAPVTDPAVTITFARQLQDFPTSVTVSTDSGTETVAVTPDDEPQRLAVPAGATQRLRLAVASLASGAKGIATGLADVSIAGVQPRRSLQIPDRAAPEVMSFRAAAGYRTGCVAVATSSACRSTLARTGEEQAGISRSFTLTEAGRYTVSAAALAVPGAALNRELDRGSAVQVTASSTAGPDPRQRPGAVLDGLPGTTWSAAPDDPLPRLTLRLPTPSRVSELVLHTDPHAPVSHPTTVRVTAGGQSVTLEVDDAGALRLPRPVLAGTIELEILKSAIRVSSDEVSGAQQILPTGISELQIAGWPSTPASSELVLDCGRGPALTVDGQLISTSVRASVTQVLSGAELVATPCGADGNATVELAAGPHVVTLSSSADTVAMGLRLTRGAGLAATAPFSGSATPGRWGSTERRVTVATEGRALLVVHENFNAGWQASLAGQRLTPVRVDGWEQAFVVPAHSSGTVTLVYAPDRPYKAGLLAGLLAALVLCWLALRARPAGSQHPGLRDGELPAPVLAAGLLGLVTLLAGLAGLLSGALAVALWWRFGRRQLSQGRLSQGRLSQGQLGEGQPGRWLLGRWQASRWQPSRWLLGRWLLGRWLPVPAGLAVAAAGVLNAIGPSVSAHPLTDVWWTQELVLLALLAVAVSALGASAGRPDEEP